MVQPALITSALYPWTLLCFACVPFLFAFPALFPDGPPAIMETVIGLLMAVEIPLVPLIAGYIMLRVGGKWKKLGVILVSISLAFMVGWAAYVIYAAVAGCPLGCCNQR